MKLQKEMLKALRQDLNQLLVILIPLGFVGLWLFASWLIKYRTM